MSDPQESPELNGVASIEEGHIQIRDPQPGGTPARLMADDSVLVFINEVPVTEPVEVFSRTSIRVTLPLFTLPRYTATVQVAPDWMSAWLELKVLKPGVFYHLQDTPPTQQLLIKTIAKPAALKDFEEIRTEILGTIQKQGVVFGLLEDNLTQALASPPPTPICIAKGRAPVYLLDQFTDYFAFPSLPDGPESLDMPPLQLAYPVLKMCKEGDRLVEKRPGRIESEGRNLKGEIVPAPDIHRPLLAVDHSVRLLKNGLEIVAAREGIPSFNGREARIRNGCVYSEPIHGTRGSIVDVQGSAQITADVMEQAQVWATQHIEIAGQVSHAQLEADENILVHGNTVKAKIASGGDASASMRLITPVKHLLVQMLKLQKMFLELKKSVPELASRTDKVIFIQLIKTQFPTLLNDAEQLWQQLKTLKKLHPRKTMVLKVVLSHLLNLEQKEFNATLYHDWVDKLGDFLLDLEALENLSSHVYLNYVQASEVFSQGNIYILGEGCYNSQLHARQHVLITGTPGYCREGLIEAGGNVIVRELGSPNGSRLRLLLQPQSCVYAELIYPGVEVRFGHAAPYHFLERQERVALGLLGDTVTQRPLP